MQHARRAKVQESRGQSQDQTYPNINSTLPKALLLSHRGGSYIKMTGKACFILAQEKEGFGLRY